MAFATYAELNDAAMGLYREQKFGDVYDLLTREGEQFPDNAHDVLYLRSCMAARGGKHDLAIGLIKEAADKGIWYSEFVMRETPSWKVLQGLPEFEALVPVFAELEKAAYVGPVMQVIEPAGGCPERQACPMLISLHGNGGNLGQSVAGWEPVLGMGWLHAALQSSQVRAMDAFVWDDQEIALGELAAHYARVTDEHSVDRARVVLGGFSMGGETALRAALLGTIPVEGFILLGPGGPMMDEPDTLLPLVEAAQAAGRTPRGYVLIGENDDDILPDALRRIVGMLNEHGIACEVEQIPGIRHEYPRSFGDYVGRALAFIEQ